MNTFARDTMSENYISAIIDPIDNILRENQEYQNNKQFIVLLSSKYFSTDFRSQNEKLGSSVSTDLINKSFALTINIKRLLGDNIYMIINDKLINEFDIKGDELFALMLHELGHVFNRFREFEEAKIIKTIDETILKELSEENESYADSFAKVNGFQNSAIMVINKYKIVDSSLSSQLDLRIKRLNSEEVYLGVSVFDTRPYVNI